MDVLAACRCQQLSTGRGRDACVSVRVLVTRVRALESTKHSEQVFIGKV